MTKKTDEHEVLRDRVAALEGAIAILMPTTVGGLERLKMADAPVEHASSAERAAHEQRAALIDVQIAALQGARDRDRAEKRARAEADEVLKRTQRAADEAALLERIRIRGDADAMEALEVLAYSPTPNDEPVEVATDLHFCKHVSHLIAIGGSGIKVAGEPYVGAKDPLTLLIADVSPGPVGTTIRGTPLARMLEQALFRTEIAVERTLDALDAAPITYEDIAGLAAQGQPVNDDDLRYQIAQHRQEPQLRRWTVARGHTRRVECGDRMFAMAAFPTELAITMLEFGTNGIWSDAIARIKAHKSRDEVVLVVASRMPHVGMIKRPAVYAFPEPEVRTSFSDVYGTDGLGRRLPSSMPSRATG